MQRFIGAFETKVENVLHVEMSQTVWEYLSINVAGILRVTEKSVCKALYLGWLYL